MDYFAGLDVSVKDTSICIVDDTGKIVREVKVASEPEALLAVYFTPKLSRTTEYTRIRMKRLRTGPCEGSTTAPSILRPWCF